MGNKSGTALLFTQQIFTDHQLCTRCDAGDIAVNRTDVALATVGHTGLASGPAGVQHDATCFICPIPCFQ